MAKMDKKWVILCSTAVAAVYAAGYFSTEAQANKASQPAQTVVSKQATTSPATSAQKTQKYKDGTFTGTGMNRRGEMEVAVSLKSDKITDVQITNWGMHYSESDIVDLPGEVIKKQSPNVDYVSGATFSSQAFMDAVQDALNQAEGKA